MKVKELKEILSKANDNATVILYNGFDEGDVFCTTAVQVSKKNYDPYCRGDSFVDGEKFREPLFVLAGWGVSYENLDEHKNECIHLVSKGPEGKESKRKADEQARIQRELEEAARAIEAEKFAAERRKRFAVNYAKAQGALREANFDDDGEAMAFVAGLVPDKYEISYVVYDRVEKKVVHKGKKTPKG